jgi:murein L,D-transpeptidase YcbB/YkuD
MADDVAIASAAATSPHVPSSAEPELRTPLEIPASGRFVLVDAASAQLFMIEDGEVRGSMRVIVGRPAAATPVVESTIYNATLNPYWYVPTDLARSIIAPAVLKDGPSYLRKGGYQILSDFSDEAEVLAPADVDWEAVADGRSTIYVRQLPGPANSMGNVKFGFGHADGIYLHDTPRKELFEATDRNLSAGCVRVEDAARLTAWLFGGSERVASEAPDQDVALPSPVPIVIMYMDTADRVQLAGL